MNWLPIVRSEKLCALFCSLPLVLLLNAWLIFAQNERTSQRISFQIEHSFDNNNDWKPKGIFSFKNPQSFLLSDLSKIQNSVKFQHHPFTTEDKVKFEKAIEANAFYKVRLATGSPHLPFVVSAVKAVTNKLFHIVLRPCNFLVCLTRNELDIACCVVCLVVVKL
jgi:hypothetical protein